ncbi:MAG TPA: histidine ammonia-lyase [Candidatus Polarisedimenticolia bacterium]|nr:histidine ammonia-lyase [Candidatus Polarisedimenticolia bacterium]
MTSNLVLNGVTLPLDDLRRVAAGGVSVSLSPEAIRRVERAHAVVRAIVDDGDQVYGVNTGFGHLKDISIPRGQLEALQYNLVRSHCAGVGPSLPAPATRVLMLLRAHVLSRGHSGVRPLVIETLLAHLNADLLPIVPEQGSVGASGDLAPLAHVALALIGEGEVVLAGRRVAAAEALRSCGIEPLRLEPKEGLSLVNGTQLIMAVGSLAALEAELLTTMADIAGACTLEALKGSHRAFDPRLHDLRPHPGQRTCAANLRALLADSPIARSHESCGRVQDAYSLRCMPQVHGASRDLIGFVRAVLEREIDAVTDNPVVLPDDGILLAGGNFHGAPPAMALDCLAVAVAGLATISERRIERLMNPALSGLPPFLTRNPGVNSGLMMGQVTAAALVSENKILAHPASVDSIPTEAGQEDHVSMGPIAARKAREVVRHARTVLAIEFLSACQALDLVAPLAPSRGVAAALAAVRRVVPRLDDDRVLSGDIAAIETMMLDGGLRAAVEQATGILQ